MRTWRTFLPFLIVLVVGVLGGVAIAALLDDDPEVATETTTTTTTEVPGSTTTTTTTASTTTTETTTTTSTTTSTTTEPPATAPLGDASTGELVGFPMRSAMAPVEAEIERRYGEPDTDTGWMTGCPLDGNEELDERLVWWGELRVRFEIVDDAEVVGGWVFGDPAPPPAPAPSPDDPSGDDIVMPEGVTWGQSIAEVAAAIGSSLDGIAGIQDVFGLTWVYDPAGEARWLAPGVSVDAPFSEVSWQAADICE